MTSRTLADIPRKLVEVVSDLRMIESDQGYSSPTFGPFFAVEDQKGWVGPLGLGCTVRVVQPGKRSPLFSAMHSNEEMGFVIAGTGQYDVAIRAKGQPRHILASYPIREGCILLAPEGHEDTRFEIFNSGSTDLTFIAFRSETASNKHRTS